MGIIAKILEGKLKEAEEDLNGELDTKKDEVMKEARTFVASQFLKGPVLVPSTKEAE